MKKTKNKIHKIKFGQYFSTEALREHYEALIGNGHGLTRAQLLKALKGTEFEEFAYTI